MYVMSASGSPSARSRTSKPRDFNVWIAAATYALERAGGARDLGEERASGGARQARRLALRARLGLGEDLSDELREQGAGFALDGEPWRCWRFLLITTRVVFRAALGRAEEALVALLLGFFFLFF